MSMTSMDTESIILTELVGEIQTPCDWSDSHYCPNEPAAWAAHARCPACAKSQWYLICSPCKDLMMMSEDGLECAQCGELVFPARRFMAQIEALEKR